MTDMISITRTEEIVQVPADPDNGMTPLETCFVEIARHVTANGGGGEFKFEIDDTLWFTITVDMIDTSGEVYDDTGLWTVSTEPPVMNKEENGKGTFDEATIQFRCPECGKVFGTNQALGAHRNRTHGVAGTSKRRR